MDKKIAIRSESVLNQNTVKVYTDGSKLHGRVGAVFYAEYPNNSPNKHFFIWKDTALCFRQKSYLVIPEEAKNLLLEKMHNQSIVVLLYSQAAIKSLIKCSVTLITRLHHLPLEIKKFLLLTLTFFACEVNYKNKPCKILH